MVPLFNNFRNFNVKIKTSKFRLGEEVKFEGFICGAGEERVYVQPDPEKNSALSNVQPSQLFSQFEHLRQKLSFLSKHMRALTHQHTHFKWTQECDEEFQMMKEVVGFTVPPTFQRNSKSLQTPQNKAGWEFSYANQDRAEPRQ